MILRSAFRALAARPAFVTATVVMLAIGIGGTTAIYSVVYHLILYPLPVEEPERLIWVWKTREGFSFSVTPSVEEIERFREATQLSAIEAMRGAEVVLRLGEASPESLIAAQVSSTFSTMVGIAPRIGRGFVDTDTVPGAPPVVIVSDDFWRARLGDTGESLGRHIQLNGVEHEVVGVMPTGFRFPFQESHFWLPLSIDPENPPRGLNVLARLAPGVTPEQASAELDGLLAASGADDGAPWTARLNTLAETLGTSTVQVVWLLLVAVALVLLIACANVANLILVHGNNRTSQLAVRSALGAGRGILVGQILLESLLLAVGGGLMGLLVAVWGLDVIRSLRPSSLPELVSAQIDWPILVFGLGVSALSGLAAGLVPACRLSRPDVGQMIRTLSASAPIPNLRLRRILITAEMALGTLLLLGAGTLVSSFANLQSADPGYRVDGLLSMRLSLPESRYPSETERADFVARLEALLRSIPGVEGVATGVLPSQAGIGRDRFEILGRGPITEPQVIPAVLAGEAYFRVAGLRLVSGREFSDSGEGQVIVGRHLARTYFPGEEAVGQQIRFSPSGGWLTIVGVADDVRAFGLQDSLERPVVYHHVQSGANSSARFLIRSPRAPGEVAAAVIERVSSLDPEMPVGEIATAEQVLSRGIGRQRFSTVLFSFFTVSGVLLACLGLYGLVSYVVAERTWEIGLRMALGADRASLLLMVLRSGLGTALIGMGVGLLGFVWFSRLLVNWLFDVRTVDPVAAAVGLALLLAAVVVAVLIPAARAAAVDPSVALRLRT